MLDVSPRTLRNWKKVAKEGHYPKVGRPETGFVQRLKYARAVYDVWFKMGRPGYRPVEAELKGRVPTRFVQKYVNGLKERERRQKRLTKKTTASKVQVLVKNTIWGQDATHIGVLNKRKLNAQVIKDRSTLKVLEAIPLESHTGDSVISLFERVKTERGQLPLVWATDNGSCYTDKKVTSYLKKENVIHLRSLPRTPEHNGATENCIKEIKRIGKLGKGTQFDGINEYGEALSYSADVLNNRWRYGSKGYLTSRELESCLEEAYNKVNRTELYAEYLKECVRINDMKGARREKRLREREMILRLLEKYELIKITRGSCDDAA